MRWYDSLAVLVLFSALAHADDVRVTREIFRTPEALAIIRGAERVEICVLRYNSLRGKKDDYRSYSEDRYVPLDQSTAALVTWKLAEDSSYTWDTAIDANPWWCARARLWKGSHFVTVDMSFDADLVVFSKDGCYFADAICGSGCEWLFQVVEEKFPKDRAVIRAKMQREERRRQLLQYEKARAVEAERRRANQSLEPTPTAVTPRACARVAPAVGVAHH
ncbi:hypothetical protein DB347_25370 [Opitutaceae bacterium EW11]|nr:hypothetical protein DB347_25370 [Opitutaceae bacterium EW11]